MSGVCPCCLQPVPERERIIVDLSKNTASRTGKSVRLSPNEAVFLSSLTNSPDGKISQQRVIRDIYGHRVPKTWSHSMHRYVQQLKPKLAKLDAYIECIPKDGWRLLLGREERQ